KHNLRVVLLQHLGDGRRQRRLAVVGVTNCPYVAVRLCPLKLFFRHFLLSSVAPASRRSRRQINMESSSSPPSSTEYALRNWSFSLNPSERIQLPKRSCSDRNRERKFSKLLCQDQKSLPRYCRDSGDSHQTSVKR